MEIKAPTLPTTIQPLGNLGPVVVSCELMTTSLLHRVHIQGVGRQSPYQGEPSVLLRAKLFRLFRLDEWISGEKNLEIEVRMNEEPTQIAKLFLDHL